MNFNNDNSTQSIISLSSITGTFNDLATMNDLSFYISSNILQIQNYINSNSIQDNLSFYLSSNILSKQNYINSNSFQDNLSFYISCNLLNKQNFINSNLFQDNLSFYISSNILNKQNHINSNSFQDNLSFYISSNILNKQNYINSNSLQDDLSFYMSSNITNIVLKPYISSNVLQNLILYSEPNVQKKFGFTATCSTSILMPDNNTYYKYDIDLRNYTGLKYAPNPNTPYRIFRITVFLASVYFEVFSSGVPNILEYKVFMSNETQNGGGGIGTAGINVCAIGRPQNYYLNSILPTYFSLLRTGDFNYLSIIARINGTVVNVIMEDLLF